MIVSKICSFRFYLPMVGLLILPSLCEASCDVAYSNAINSVLNEGEISQFLECKSEPVGPKRKQVIHSLCVISGKAKEGKIDEMGNETVTVISGGDTEAEKLFPEVVGTWFSHKVYAKGNTEDPVESYTSVASNLGIKITKNAAKNVSVGRFQVDRIQVSNLEKKLIFERLHRLGNSPQLKLDRDYSLDCSKAALKSEGDDSPGKAGKPPPGSKAFGMRNKKDHKPYQKPNSAISSGSEK